MMFRLANKTKMFITTESLTGAIDLDPAVAYATDSGLGATDGIATGTAIRKLGDVVDDTNTRSMIPGLLGIDTPDTGSIREDLEIYNGLKSTTSVDIKKEYTVTLLIIRNGGVWDRVFNEASHGLNATPDGLFDTLTVAASNPNIGYRLYEYDGTSWNVYRHCRILPGGYSKDVSAVDGTVKETVVFTTNDYQCACPEADIDNVAAII